MTLISTIMKFSIKSAFARLYAFSLMTIMSVLICMSPARAQLVITVDGGNFQPISIAVTDFLADTDLGTRISDVIAADLERSGLFAPIDKQAFVERINNFDTPPRFADWQVLNTEAVLVGQVVRTANGDFVTQFRLWDVAANQQIAARQYVTNNDNWRRVAHMIADQIYQKLTGEQPYFDTRIVFVDETGPGNARIKRLAIMDQDGANLTYLTDGREMVLTPRFSPTRQEVTYMSFTDQTPRVYRLSLDSGQRELVGNFPNMTIAPRFSPDGNKVIMSLLEQNGAANLYVMDLTTRQTLRLTSGPAIDTSASFSPDGSQIVFESDRGGRQQIYVMNADGSDPQRISFGEGSYSTPVWSPRGDYIAFTKQQSGQFSIGVIKPDGSGERLLTTGFHNEGPTWSPNGRVIMFFRSGSGQGPRLYTIDVTGRNERMVMTPHDASDPAWSPLLR